MTMLRLRKQMWNEAWSRIRPQINYRIESQIWKMRDQVRLQTWEQVSNQMIFQVEDQVEWDE